MRFADAWKRRRVNATCVDRMLEHGFIRQVGMTGARRVGPGLCAHTEKRAKKLAEEKVSSCRTFKAPYFVRR